MSVTVRMTEGWGIVTALGGDPGAPTAQPQLGLHRLAALTLLVVLGPLLAFVAVLVWATDGAPVLFGHYRVGQGGRVFKCLKFRTMRRDARERLAELLATDPVARAEWAANQKLVDDPRVTAIGRFLRKTSLDELPQLLNVVRGEMSLVGPRPITVDELRRYGGSRWHYLSVLPGITGLWQVSGRSDTTYEERIQLDRDYVAQRSRLGDLGILLRTLGVVVGRGAR